MDPICEVCGKAVANCSPFRCDGKRYVSVCGGCKIRLTLAPKRKAALESEIRTALATVEKAGK